MATRSQSRDTTVSSNHAGPRKRPSKSLRQQPKQEEAVDDSAWIHRDKLAAIEIQEMEEAGMHVRQPNRSDSVGQGGRTTRSSSRSMSRNGVRKAQSKDLLNEEEQFAADREEYERKRVSTIHAADEEEYYDQEYDALNDVRAMQEFAPDQSFKGHTLRPSTSKIPISKINAAAVSDAVGDDSGPAAYPSSWEDMKRMRAGSMGSAVLLDENEQSVPRPPSAHLPPSPGREASTTQTPRSQPPTSVPRKRQDRSTSAQRPPSSSGQKRPTTSHQKPEGEAPWIATMYKPDPRLPPDQQMLPTHAKRMMQEQREREEAMVEPAHDDSQYVEEAESQSHPQPQPQPPRRSIQETKIVVEPPVSDEKENVPPAAPPKDENEEWPLTPTSEKREGAVSPQPSVNGGYRITPTIMSNSPTPQTPRASTGPIELPAVEKPKPTRLPDYDEKDNREATKGCCCVMM